MTARSRGTGVPVLDRFLDTDPRDVGCDQLREIVDIYVDLLRAGAGAAARYAGVATHLRSCDACQDDLDGLLAAAAATFTATGTGTDEGRQSLPTA